MDVLVIGGSGFVGRHLVPMLLAQGHAVTLLNRGTAPVQATRQLLADRNNPQMLRDALAGCGVYDCVIDTSAYTPLQTQTARTILSGHALRWVHLSSAAVYSNPDPKGLSKEGDAAGGFHDWGPYATDKATIDAWLCKQKDMPTIILRPPYLFGPYNNNDRETFIWSRLMKGRPVVVPGCGDYPMQFLHAHDLARALCACLDIRVMNTVDVYNVSHACQIGFSEWVALLAEIAGLPSHVVEESGTSGMHPRAYFPFGMRPCSVDPALFMKVAAWAPVFDLRSGFQETFEKLDRVSLAGKHIDTAAEDAVLDRIIGAKNRCTT